jgi:hypothetical protein
MAGTIAIRMQQNTFRRKFEDYIRPDPQNADRRRKGYTAVAAKMARVGVRGGHNRHRLSPLPGSDETRREDPFALCRRGVCDLVDNARTFHLECNALLSPVKAGAGGLTLCDYGERVIPRQWNPLGDARMRSLTSASDERSYVSCGCLDFGR